MNEQISLGLNGNGSEPEESLALAEYAQRAYLEYALSVVKGRALPDVADGQKPVQRRILYAMQRMGLGYGGAAGNTPARPVKSARVVGDVLGRFHPHGDQAAYDALVRMAQDFSQRYPLIDGHGNFGSRDGDGAAAMRYTEARLARITRLLLSEIDQGTVDFVANYDGSTEEPVQLPARLPFALLNGASGIAVGMATEIPSHNLREVADACIALIQEPQLGDDALFDLLPGPDYPGGGQIISPRSDIRAAYLSGRGSLRVRARWRVENLARGQWQVVVDELPPGASTQRVLEQIEQLTNPKVRNGKKTPSQEQLQLKSALLAVLSEVRDESGKDAPVRIVLEPKSRTVDRDAFINTLLAHTYLETTAPINLTGIGLDGRPVQKSLRQILEEWIAYRSETISRRSRHRLQKVLDRIHILEGRQLVLLNIDEVIAIIRGSDEPKAALIARFALSERQAEDILDIRLRQLARLEAIRIEQELSELRGEQAELEKVLDSPAALRRLMVREIKADAATFADSRRTLIEHEDKATAEIQVLDEAVTVVVSRRGWVRARQGHGHDPASFEFKTGDSLYATFECRTVDSLLVLGNNGRAYSVSVAQLPGARGDGQPVTALIDLEAGTQPVHYFAGAPTMQLLLAGSGGYGFLATAAAMASRQRAGKAFVRLEAGEQLLPLTAIAAASAAPDAAPSNPGSVACVARSGRILVFDLAEIRQMDHGGRGLMLMRLADDDRLVGAVPADAGITVSGRSSRGKFREKRLNAQALEPLRGRRARVGRDAKLGFTPDAATPTGASR
ncbi:MAG: DNA topoisomerase IV subunit A [Ottowia sp.]|nr:DNA topoisomerase IV subunit A [Ottowia sp.]